MGYRVGSVMCRRPDGVVHRMFPLGRCSAFHRGCCLSRWSNRHFGSALHRQVRPPASYGMLCEPGQSGGGDGEVDVPHEPGRDHPGQRAARPRLGPRRRVLGHGLGVAGAPGRGTEGPGVHAEQDVQERPGPQRIHPAVQPRLLELPGPRGDPLVGGQHLSEHRAKFRAVNSSHASGICVGPCGVHPSAGRRRITSATAACLRLLT
jgi:hypothetical protein